MSLRPPLVQASRPSYLKCRKKVMRPQKPAQYKTNFVVSLTNCDWLKQFSKTAVSLQIKKCISIAYFPVLITDLIWHIRIPFPYHIHHLQTKNMIIVDMSFSHAYYACKRRL
jgi:hypothetical protein